MKPRNSVEKCKARPSDGSEILPLRCFPTARCGGV
jgi:hypothetical protein